MPPYVIVPMPNRNDASTWTNISLPLDFLRLPQDIQWVWDPQTKAVYNSGNGEVLDINNISDEMSRLTMV